MIGAIRKYSLTIKGHRTSISLEEPFHSALVEMSNELGKSLPELIGEIDSESRQCGLSSAIRIYVLDYYRTKAGSQD